LANLCRIYNILPVSSASAEQSFSRLKQIKSYTYSTMEDPIVGLIYAKY